MASNIGYKLNRLFEASYVAADLAVSFVAVQLESTQANAIFVHGVDFLIAFPSAADRTSFVQQEIQCFRDLRIINGVAAAVQADQGKERIWGFSSENGGEHVDFDEPLKLEPGYIYTFVLFPALFDPALAGSVDVGLTVRGELLPWAREEKLPVELRTGTAEDPPDCVQVSEA